MRDSNAECAAYLTRWTFALRRHSGIQQIAAICVGAALTFSCMLVSGCGGPTDPRLVGVWESRQGFTKSTRIKFAADGGMIVATKTEGKDSEQMKGSWHVATTENSKRITITVSLKGQSRERSVKFLTEDLIEMSQGTEGGVRRFTRVSGK